MKNKKGIISILNLYLQSRKNEINNKDKKDVEK